MKALTRFPPSVVLAIALGSALACGRGVTETSWETMTDLTTRASVASVFSETGLIDFGTPEARPLLLSGWTGDQVDGNGLTFVQSAGNRSAVEFFLGNVRSVPVKFRCRSRPGQPSVRSIALAVNGTTVDAIALEDRLKTYKVTLPAQFLVPGNNELAFIYTTDGTVTETAPFPPVNFFRLEFLGARAARESPLAEPGRQVLFVPFGIQIDFPVIVGPGVRLEADRIDFRGGSSSRLVVEVASDEGRRVVENVSTPQRLANLELPAPEIDAVILRMKAESRGEWTNGDGVYLRQPRLTAPVEALGPQVRGAAPVPRPNILIYLVDTLRSDHLATYGHGRPTSPRLDEFARTATLFEKAVGQSSWTRPSVASLFTGQWPGTHSVVKRRDALPPEALTLAELLRGAGYVTGAFSTNPNVSKAFGFAQGFDDFHLMPQASDSAALNEEVFPWVERRSRDEPFFLYVQPADPHNPYLPPERLRREFAPNADEIFAEIEQNPSKEAWDPKPMVIRQLLDLYDGEIAANDESFGALLDYLEKLSLLDDMLVIFLSDHGEEFFEHGGWSHGRTLHAESLDFPLVVKLPQQERGARVSEIVQHIDIMATIVDLVGLDPPATSKGRSLLPLVRSTLDSGPQVRSWPRPAFAHVSLVGGLRTSVVAGKWKLIDRRSKTDLETRLFQWPEDPMEANDLAQEYPVRTATLKAILDEKIASTEQRLETEEATLDPDIEQRLRALGYL